MKLYTKTGDDGTTGLIGGRRVPKTDARVAAYGDVDELNAVIGWCRAAVPGERGARLQRIQADLFVIGAELASVATTALPANVAPIDAAAVARLEGWIDEASGATPPLTSFILPGGSEGGARLHLVRAVCRRAERSVVELHTASAINDDVLRYLNRLSDLLFAWARQHDHEGGLEDIPWRP